MGRLDKTRVLIEHCSKALLSGQKWLEKPTLCALKIPKRTIFGTKKSDNFSIESMHAVYTFMSPFGHPLHLAHFLNVKPKVIFFQGRWPQIRNKPALELWNRNQLLNCFLIFSNHESAFLSFSSHPFKCIMDNVWKYVDSSERLAPWCACL